MSDPDLNPPSDQDDLIPVTPRFADEEFDRCRETGDYRPILFEWYKFVGSHCVLLSHIRRESPAYKKIAAREYHVLVGLLTRCARLMLSNVALSHEGRFGETTAIIDRCIFESAVKIQWLCVDPKPDKFMRFCADGLRTEIEFKAQIEANIAARRGRALPIETRMLTSIRNHMAAAELTEPEIETAKRLPDLASMLDSLGHHRLLYVVGQRIGSHHVHGTWPSLIFHYLEKDETGAEGVMFRPRGHDCDTDVAQFLFVPQIVLRAMAAYVSYAFEDGGNVEAFLETYQATEEEIIRVYAETRDADDLTTERNVTR